MNIVKLRTSVSKRDLEESGWLTEGVGTGINSSYFTNGSDWQDMKNFHTSISKRQTNQSFLKWGKNL
jgi:hypothetical protein